MSAGLNERVLEEWTELGKAAASAVAGAEHSKGLLVVSPGAGEGRTTTACALGIAFSGLGRTLLIDAHAGKGGLSRLFGQPAAPGLSDVLAGDADLAAVLCPTAIDDLWFLPCGRRFAGPQGALAMFRGEVFGELMVRLRGEWDRIVCDTPPFLEEPTAAAIAAQFDGSVLVLSCDSTRWEVAQLVQERLAATSARLVGAVLNRRRHYVPNAIYRAL
jgi:protein-tyrosine kinase